MVDIGKLIVSTPGIVGGRLRLAGTRISIRNIAIWHHMGWTAEEIVRRYTHLTLDKVYAGLAYYYANKETLDAQFAAEEAEEDLIEKEYIAKHGTLHPKQD
jgi:uncharacterized protein (DUF433 family)